MKNYIVMDVEYMKNRARDHQKRTIRMSFNNLKLSGVAGLGTLVFLASGEDQVSLGVLMIRGMYWITI